MILPLAGVFLYFCNLPSTTDSYWYTLLIILRWGFVSPCLLASSGWVVQTEMAARKVNETVRHRFHVVIFSCMVKKAKRWSVLHVFPSHPTTVKHLYSYRRMSPSSKPLICFFLTGTKGLEDQTSSLISLTKQRRDVLPRRRLLRLFVDGQLHQMYFFLFRRQSSKTHKMNNQTNSKQKLVVSLCFFSFLDTHIVSIQCSACTAFKSK